MVINPIKFWLSLIQWPLAMSLDSPEAPKPDPKIGEASVASIKLAEKQEERAAGMMEWIKSVTGPIINQQMAAGDETQRQAIAQNVNFQTLYPALETRMVLDTLGYSDLNDADAEQVLTSFGEREAQILQGRYTQDMNDIAAARKRSADQAAAGTPGASSLTPEYFDEQERLAQENLTKQQGLAENKLGLVRNTRTSEKAAQEIEAGRAKADVTLAGDAQQKNIDMQLKSMGVNPASPRYNAIRRNLALQTSAGVAGAGTNARRFVAGQQSNDRMNALNYGKGYPGQVASISATGTGQGSQATGNVNQAGGGILQAGNAPLQGYQTGISGLTQYHNSQVNYANANDNSALWGMAGQALGTFAAFKSSKKLKTHKKKVDHKGILEKVRGLPVEEWEYEPGMTHIPGAKAGVKHIGPYAEDMKQTFGVGDGKTIHPADQGGIILSAIKELSEKVNKLEHRRAA